MTHGVALKMRAIRVHPKLLVDEYLFMNLKTGEVYVRNRAGRRKEEVETRFVVSRHERQRIKPRGWKAAARARRKLARASRRRNR